MTKIRRPITASRLAVLAAAASAASTSIASATPPAACGQVESPTGTVLNVVSYSNSCGDAKRVMREYFTAVRNGKCEGHGQSCRLLIRRHTCTVTSASAFEDTGVAAKCVRGSKRVDAEQPS